YADIKLAKANDNAMWLIKRLMADHNIPVANVVPHQRWPGKQCPRKLLPIWPSFVAKLSAANAVEAPKKPTSPVTDKVNAAPSKPKPVSNNVSIVDYLNANGINSSFANRAKLAAQYGIKNYSGTAAQNTALLA